MANLGEVPFRRYYGTVDATPLFLLLAGMYLDRTGDMETIGTATVSLSTSVRQAAALLIKVGKIHMTLFFMLMAPWPRAPSRYARSRVMSMLLSVP
jgi:hypothetical protein